MMRKSQRNRRRTLLQKANAEIRRLEQYAHWFKFYAEHARWCPKNRHDLKECTCGYDSLFNALSK